MYAIRSYYALGLLFGVDPNWTMPAFGLLVGLGIMVMQRSSGLSSDTVIGVFFSSMVAFGLAIVSRDRSLARDLQRFLYGRITSYNVCYTKLLRLIGMNRFNNSDESPLVELVRKTGLEIVV